MSPDEIEDHQYEYADILTSENLWKSVTCPESHLSRAALRLIQLLCREYAGNDHSLKDIVV